eukprot:353465-Chlamydomonas_euryale.AAC.4
MRLVCEKLVGTLAVSMAAPDTIGSIRMACFSEGIQCNGSLTWCTNHARITHFAWSKPVLHRADRIWVRLVHFKRSHSAFCNPVLRMFHWGAGSGVEAATGCSR